MKEPTQIVNDIHIFGGNKLSGEVITNSAKNSTVAILAASVLNRGTTTLHNISRIEDVFRLLEVMESIGIQIDWLSEKSIKITPPPEFDLNNLDIEAINKGGRSTILFFGGLIHLVKKFNWPHAGGCKMGERTVAAHKHGLEALGVEITTRDDDYVVENKGLRAADIVMYEASDTATENILVAASGINDTTTIRFAPPNYQVQEVCFFLEQLGVRIEGIGTTTLKVTGLKEVNKDIEYTIGEDPIESMMFIAAALMTESKLMIKRCPIDFLRLELLKLDYMGAKIEVSQEYFSENGGTKLVDITVKPSKLTAAVDKIHPLPYPGINVDNLPFFAPIATQSEGVTLIHDWMWENRAIYFTELNRLGADVRLADPHRVFITGKTKLKGARIVCPPALRPSMIILISMLAAEGESILHSVYPINRGYENIFERFNNIGADIRVFS